MFAHIRPYKLKLHAGLQSYTDSNSFTFSINIKDSCDQVLVTKKEINTHFTYDIQSKTVLSLGKLTYTRDLT